MTERAQAHEGRRWLGLGGSWACRGGVGHAVEHVWLGRLVGPWVRVIFFLSPRTLSDIYYKKETEFVAPIVSYNKSTYLGAWA
jgi:hypothetical protein